MARLIQNPTTGERMIEDPQTPGGWRPLTGNEYGQLSPRKVLDEMGVSDSTRFVLKNFARNPALGLSYLRSLGYDAFRYGDGFNYAVRKDPSEPFKVVDPVKGGWGEAWRDLTDLTSDAVQTGLFIAAAPTTILGSAALAGGAELARQGIGEMAGIKGNLSPLSPETAIAGASGAIGQAVAPTINKVVQGAGRVASSTVHQAGKLTEEIIGRITSIKPQAGLSVADAILERAALRSGGKFIPLPPPSDVVQTIQAHLEAVGGKTGQLNLLKQTAASFVDDAHASGMGIDISDLQRPLRQLSGELSPRAIEKLDPTQEARAQELRDSISALLNPPKRTSFVLDDGSIDTGAFRAAQEEWESSLKNFDIRAVERMKQLIQRNVADKNKSFALGMAASESLPSHTTRETVGDISKVGNALNERLREALPERYGQLNDQLSTAITARDGMRDHVGEGMRNAEGFVANLLKTGHSPDRAVVEQYDKVFNTNFYRTIRQSAIGLSFTPQFSTAAEFGVPRAFPRLTPQGQVLGLGLLGGSTAMGGIPGLVGSGAAMGAGIAIASPAGLVKMAPGAHALYTGMKAAAQSARTFTLPSTVSAPMKGLLTTTMEGIARQDMGKAATSDTLTPQRKRRANFVTQ